MKYKDNTVTFAGNTYTLISNSILSDSNISTSAKGLYAIIMMYVCTPFKSVTKESIMEAYKEGKQAFQSDWEELRSLGYLVQYQDKDEKGKYHYSYKLKDSTYAVRCATNHLKEEEYDIPELNEIEEYSKTLDYDVLVDEFYEYYSKRNWCDKYGKKFNWKNKLKYWKK